MEALSQELVKKISVICGKYYFNKKTDAVQEAEKLHEEIQKFTTLLIQRLSVQESSEEKTVLLNYAVQVWNDYVEAIRYKDIVLMIDTLDFGLWELLDIFKPETNDGEDEKE